jgi:hypothetical protein
LDERKCLLAGTRALLACLTQWLHQISTLDWDGTAGFMPVMRRSVLRRQFDSLEIVAALVESNQGYAAVPLLRPACEELFWIRYLESVNPAEAGSLLDCLIDTGLLRDLKAQFGEVGQAEMFEIGLLPALTAFRVNENQITLRLKELGRRLKWPPDVVRSGKLPSTWFVAGTNDESKKLYRFLYHATSRYVHFSPVELCRRGWGKPGRLEFSSETYEPIWALFSLAWGARLFVWTIEASLPAILAEGAPAPDHKSIQQAFDTINEIPLIPLVTLEEMSWFK